MLFKHKHLLEELRRDGRHGTAEILSMKTVGEGSSVRAMWAADDDLSSGWMDCSMRLRVVPDERGEPPFEATVTTRIHTLKFQGSSVPVWYDPRDTSKLVVDYEADLASQVYWMGESERLAHRHDQRLGLAWTPLPGCLFPLEVLPKQGKGRVEIKGHLDKVFGVQALAAVAYVRGHLAALAPDLDPAWFSRNDLHVFEPYGQLPSAVTPEVAGSAGLAVAAALASLISRHMVRPEVALTGAISPSGELLPVGDLREKVRCARDSYAQILVAPKASEPDAHLVTQKDRRDLQLVFAATPVEALHTALTRKAAGGHSRLP